MLLFVQPISCYMRWLSGMLIIETGDHICLHYVNFYSYYNNAPKNMCSVGNGSYTNIVH